MYGRKSYERKSAGNGLSIMEMLTFCALFSFLLLLLAPAALQPASAQEDVTPDRSSEQTNSVPGRASAQTDQTPDPAYARADKASCRTSDHTASCAGARYRRCTDGIWRRNTVHRGSAVLVPALPDPLSIIDPSVAYSSHRLHIQSALMTPERLIKSCVPSDDRVQASAPDTPDTAVCCFTGDIMCLRGQQYDAATRKGFNFLPSYRFVSSIFNDADFVCGNLETLVSPSNPLTKDRKTDDNGTPVCNAPAGLLCALRKAGFDMLLTAHNHCCDYGAEGIIETKQNLDRYHFANAGTSYPGDGTGTNDSYCVFEVNGINIAVLTYTHLINQRSLMSREELDTMVSRYDSERIGRDIAEVRAAGAEFVVVYSHWGIENTEELAEYQIRDSEKIAEAGADLIIGSHPHCLQPGRFIETSDGRTVFCIYSMGNFCSSMERDINNDTIILRLELTRAADGSVTSALSYIPCRVMSYHRHSFVVVPTNSDLNGGIFDRRLKEADERIGEVLGKTEGGTLPKY